MQYLFEGQYDDQCSIRSAQQVFKNALENLTSIINGLRYRFATHLMEYGADTKFVQELMGHADIKATKRYLHVSNQRIKKIIIPLDKI